MIRDQRFQGTRIIWFVSIELYEFNIRCKQGWAGNILILCLCQNRIILRTSYYFLKDDVDHGR